MAQKKSKKIKEAIPPPLRVTPPPPVGTSQDVSLPGDPRPIPQGAPQVAPGAFPLNDPRPGTGVQVAPQAGTRMAQAAMGTGVATKPGLNPSNPQMVAQMANAATMNQGGTAPVTDRPPPVDPSQLVDSARLRYPYAMILPGSFEVLLKGKKLTEAVVTEQYGRIYVKILSQAGMNGLLKILEKNKHPYATHVLEGIAKSIR